MTSSTCRRLSSAAEASVPSTVVHSHLLKTGLLFFLPAGNLFSTHGRASSPTAAPAVSNLLRGNSADVGGGADLWRWNAMLSALSHCGFPSAALWVFSAMHKLGLPLCSYSLCSALVASIAKGTARIGKQVHAHSAKSGWISAVFVGGALVNLYVKLGAIDDAGYAFDEIRMKNATCVNTLLMGYVGAKLWGEGVKLVKRMPSIGVTPDGFTMCTLLKMCAEVPAASLGMQVHAHLLRRTSYLQEDFFVQSSLTEMYGKCGLVNEAQLVFDLAGNILPGRKRDVVLWTSMLNAFGRNGRFNKVIETFGEMLNEGVKPDEVTFTAVLAACSQTGDVSRALYYFMFMSNEHHILPRQEHYACVIDVLCRAGQLEKAWKFANEMTMGEEDNGGATSVRIWGALLSACREFGNVGMGRLAAERALGLDPSNVGIYMELSNMYARMGMWDEIEKLRDLLNDRRLKKDVGFSRIELPSLGTSSFMAFVGRTEYK